jgi:hypothetical protein
MTLLVGFRIASKSGPSISPTVIARKSAAARNTSKTAAGTEDRVIRDSSHWRARWPRPHVRPLAGHSLLLTHPRPPGGCRWALVAAMQHPPDPSGTRGEATMVLHARYGSHDFVKSGAARTSGFWREHAPAIRTRPIMYLFTNVCKAFKEEVEPSQCEYGKQETYQITAMLHPVGASRKTAVLRNYAVPLLHHSAQKPVVRDSRHLTARPACRFGLPHIMVE